jgi:hypothetical protein
MTKLVLGDIRVDRIVGTIPFVMKDGKIYRNNL